VGVDSVRIKISSVAGDVLADFEFAGDWQVFGLSPAQRYLVAANTALTEAVILRLSDKERGLARQPAEMPIFSPDDAHSISVAKRPYLVPFQQV